MMGTHRHCDLLIAGGGPAGLSTALHLLRRRPESAGRIVVLERRRHPRLKVCAGGLIPRTIQVLDDLGLALTVPSVELLEAIARTPVGEVRLARTEPLLTVVRRDEFDAYLARSAVDAGCEIIEECRVHSVEQWNDGVIVSTNKGVFEAPVLVGADGSGSRVRTAIFGRGPDSIGRALMVDLPVDGEGTEGFAGRRSHFDFRCVEAGIAGYAWVFPCVVEGRAMLNVGIYDQRPAGARSIGHHVMIDQLRVAFPQLGLGDLGRHPWSYQAFPIRWYDPRSPVVAGRVMLAGDAAGVDPLMGEGISWAFEHGRLAAGELERFFDGDREALERYGRSVSYGVTGRKLLRLASAARRFYGRRYRLYFRLAGMTRAAQEIGMDWYNGVGGIDRLSTRALMGRWLRAVLFGPNLS